MEHLKTFENFIIETTDIMMYPGNYIEDTDKLYKNIIHDIGIEFKKIKGNILKSLKLPKEDIFKVKEFIKDKFDSNTIKINKENIEKLIWIFNLKNVNESYVKYARGESIIIKALVRVSEILNISAISLSAIGIPLTVFSEHPEYSNHISFVWISAALIAFILNSIVKTYGYHADDKSMNKMPGMNKMYDFEKDIRNKRMMDSL